MGSLLVAAAALTLLAGAAIHALNALISFRERGFVEPWDIPLAVALGVAAILTWRASRYGPLVGAAACAVALLLVMQSGALPLIAFWSIAMLLALLASPLVRSRVRRSQA